MLSRSDSLGAIPVINLNTKMEETAKGNLVLKVEVRRGKGFLARFQPPTMEKVVELDELGSFVFRQIDGKKTTSAIVNAFAKKFRTNRREAELSTVEFLKSLAVRQIISIVIK